MNVLYLGSNSGTSRDRAAAYARLGHDVTHIDLRELLPKGRWVDHTTWHVSDRLLAPLVRLRLTGRLGGRRFDFCHVDSGEWVHAGTVRLLKNHCGTVINYNVDDPTGVRDQRRFRCYQDAVPEYDLVAVVRDVNVMEVAALRAKKVVRVFRSADEVSHHPLDLTEDDHARWDSDVLFIGTWMPGRDAFLMNLLERGVPLAIRGARWQKAPEWNRLKPHWRGDHVEGAEYAKAIQCARVNLGLLSAENRDLHTTRSLEIPSLGGLLCAERTSEHLSLYTENIEALFWENAAQCAEKCKWALSNPLESEKIARSGRARFKRNRHTNETILQALVEETIKA